MPYFLNHDDIDKEKWNACLQSSANPTIFADYDFLTAASPRWKALIEGDYDYIMPLPARSKFSVKYIYTPFFFSRLGIFSPHQIEGNIVRQFIEKIPATYRYIDLVFNSANNFENTGYSPLLMNSYRLDLNEPYLKLYQSYSENTRRNIRNAVKQELSLTDNITPEDVIKLFRSGKGKEKAVPYHKKDYAILLKLSRIAQEKGQLDLIGVCDQQQKLIAGAFFLKDHERIWFWFSGRDKKSPEKKSMFFLIDAYIKDHAGQPVLFDFNGSMNENIARFYRGFGAQKYTYPMLNIRRYFYLSPFVRLYKNIIK